LLEKDLSLRGMRSMYVARVLLFFSFTHEETIYPSALVHWFVSVADGPDEATGMWSYRPAYFHGERVVSVVHLDMIV
jgi:hypothetical protein